MGQKLPKGEKDKALKRMGDTSTAPRKEIIMSGTFDRMMKKPSFKQAFDEEYRELVVSELIYEMIDVRRR